MPRGRPPKPKTDNAVLTPDTPPDDSGNVASTDNSDNIENTINQVVDTVAPTDEVVAKEDLTLTRYRNYLSTLPFETDDIDIALGPEIKERMMLDPIINANLHWLVEDALDQPIRYSPVIRDKKDADFQKSKDVYDFCMRAIEPIEDDIIDVLYDMGVDHMGFGHKIAEKVCALQRTGVDKGKLYFASIKPRPRDAVKFVVDPHMNTVGIACRVVSGADSDGKVIQPEGDSADKVDTNALNGGGTRLPPGWKIFPRSKFSVVTFRKCDGDPRGASVLRHIYYDWYLLQAIFPHYYKYLTKFGSPSVVGETAPGPAVRRAAGGVNVRAVDELFKDLLKYENASVFAIPNGGKLQLLFSQGGGEAFIAAINLLQTRFTRGITNQTLASGESRHMARAASETHQDSQNVVVRYIKRNLMTMHRRDHLKYIVRLNFGEQFMRFAPICTLGDIAPEDVATAWSAVATLKQANYLDDSQARDIDAMIGLPYRENPGFPKEESGNVTTLSGNGGGNNANDSRGNPNGET